MSAPRTRPGFGLSDAAGPRIVPPSGFTAQLTVFAAAVMAFLGVFAMALALASGRLASEWSNQLAGGATIRISAPAEMLDTKVAATLAVLQTTPGVADARALSAEEQQALLAPWFGTSIDISNLPVPRLIEVEEDAASFDVEGLRLRLAAEVPEAVLDDHVAWREPLVRAAHRLRALGWLGLGLITAATAAMITLAANAALSANASVIAVLRLVGATDRFIADAFVRRFTLRGLGGALAGMMAGFLGLLSLHSAGGTTGLLAGFALSGWHWAMPVLVPPLVALAAFLATRAAARRTLERLS